jgi:3-oxoacyl-[acyl-carrier protein] reductase
MTQNIALVTGASRGIGKACAIALGKISDYVIGTATTEDSAKKITAELVKQNIAGEGMVLDVADKSSMDALFDTLKSQDKLPRVLVNNAGITRDNLLLRMKDDEWNEVLQTNLTGVYYMCKLFSKPMIKQRTGRIINISSVSALMGNPGQCNYAAAKAGAIAFSRSLAKEIASRNVTVNVVAPGFIESDMTLSLPEAQRAAICKTIPMGRMGEPDDIASVVAFLASDEAKYITGETIQISGGLI